MPRRSLRLTRESSLPSLSTSSTLLMVSPMTSLKFSLRRRASRLTWLATMPSWRTRRRRTEDCLLRIRVIFFDYHFIFFLLTRLVGASAKLGLSTQAVADLGKDGIAATDDSFKYEKNVIQATVKAIWNGKTFGEALAAVCFLFFFNLYYVDSFNSSGHWFHWIGVWQNKFLRRAGRPDPRYWWCNHRWRIKGIKLLYMFKACI